MRRKLLLVAVAIAMGLLTVASFTYADEFDTESTGTAPTSVRRTTWGAIKMLYDAKEPADTTTTTNTPPANTNTPPPPTK